MLRLHHFSLPKRVSRLYPLFSLILALSSTILLIAWQSSLAELQNFSQVNERQKLLENHIQQLTSDQTLNQTRLQLQNQKISDASGQLADLEKQLDARNTELNAKDSQLKQAQEQLKNQQSQLTQNASEISGLRARPPLFSFQNQSSLANVSSKEADVEELVTNAYQYISNLYGQPYLLNSVIITFVDSFSIPGSAGEIVIENSKSGIKINIHLKDFDKTDFQDNNTVIHEIIHGFHGVAVFQDSALEEGITVATTDAVMQQMIRDKKLPAFEHLYLTTDDNQYAVWNNSLPIYSNNDTFYSDKDISKVYQLIGTAWYRLYLEDPAFFKKLNAAYYPKIQKGLNADTPLILDAVRSVRPTVNGQSIDTYLSTNRAFNPH